MPDLTHFDESGAARMVDTSGKETTLRQARAAAFVTMQPQTLQRVRSGDVEKGDVLQVARLAGIMASKRTADLIPLCHPLGLDAAEVDFQFEGDDRLRIEATVTTRGRTGVEMEALTAVSVAALTVYDMLKSADRGIEIGPLGLVEKSGGKSGHFTRELGDH